MKNKGFSLQLMVFLIPLTTYLIYGLRIHTWESYLYSDIIDGFQNLRSVFFFQNQNANTFLSDFPSIDIFHPNHPLPHLLIRLFLIMSAFLKIKMTSLMGAQYLNNLAGAIGVLYFYKTLVLLGLRKLESFFGALILAFSNVYWYQAISGEAYSLAICFSIIGFHFLFRHYQDRNKSKNLILASVFISLALISHMLTLFYLPAFLFFIRDRSRDIRFNISNFSKILLPMFGGGILFYLLPHLLLNQSSNSLDTIKTLNVYSSFLGFWHSSQINYTTSILTSFTHLSNCLISPSNYLLSIFNLLFLTSTLVNLILFTFKRNRPFVTNAITVFTFYFLITFIINIPNVNDYWIFIFPFLLLPTFYRIKNFKYSYYILASLLVFVAITNFLIVVLPQSKNFPTNYWVSKKVNLEARSSIAAISSHPFSHQLSKQAWHLTRMKNTNWKFVIMNTQDHEQVARLEGANIDRLNIFSDFTKQQLENFLQKNFLEKLKITTVNTFEINDRGLYQNTSMDFSNKLEDWKMNQFLVEKN